jgi:signal transduction histidine kinase
MNQVFTNLLDNAFKFTPPGGMVTVHTWTEGRSACFSIADTGSGIPPDDLPHIFERFYHAGNKHEGTGLGLAIVESIVKGHGGAITVDSVLGEGATATVRFPAA